MESKKKKSKARRETERERIITIHMQSVENELKIKSLRKKAFENVNMQKKIIIDNI